MQNDVNTQTESLNHTGKASGRRGPTGFQIFVWFSAILIVGLIGWRLVNLLLPTPPSAINWLTALPTDASQTEASKPTLLLFTGESWCPGCIMLARDVFSRDDVAQKVHEKVIPVKYDFPPGGAADPDEEKSQMADKYGIEAFPTLLLVDNQGNVLSKRVGSMPAESFLLWIDTQTAGQSSSSE